MADSVRIDKYLWAIRVYKTRSEATEACNGNKIKVGGIPAKPSKMVKIGEEIEIRKGAISLTYKVKALLEKRVGASLVPDYAINLTPQSELDKMHAPVETFFVRRDRGAGRPTKKERREIDRLINTDFYDED
ncbi:MAG: RNA-binding S4 domain-containing protein [Bacteroidales bacterium]|nr:RNA-binding S4 domain-containing protein [Bacteroidales bacterium]